ncbi:MAG: YkgJ family cysteine cluster protein [Nitrospirota bacterium]
MKRKTIAKKLDILTPQRLESGDRPQRMRLERRTSCVRCGKCCTASSPSLMKEDLPLFVAGVLSCDTTYTIRDGERVRSRQDGAVYESFTELIKLKEGEGTGGCMFYRGKEGCSIYEHRPSQCRAYKCWAPENLYEGLEASSLKRRDLFASVDLLLEVMNKHDEKCSYRRLADAFDRLAGGDEQAVEEIMDMLQYDTYARPFLQERFSVPESALDLILGRPLAERIAEFGFRVVRQGDDYVVMPIEDTPENEPGKEKEAE